MAADPRNTLEFALKIRCANNRDAPKNCVELETLYENSKVYSKDLQWIPLGDQKQWFSEDDRPRAVSADILLAQLRPHQEIECRCHCVKGIGRDHAKFSPVAVASYRLMPEITLKRNHFSVDDALLLQSCFSKGVLQVHNHGDYAEVEVKNPRADMCSRNVFRYPKLASEVLLTKKKRHFIFTVESTGALTSAELVIEACRIMQQKCKVVLAAMDLVA
ncbi:unnamed protein product [Soboliphyme baturini]|uniref:RPOLD domain-containing protein n=1 Tax=Soboliphyme baturini TaxID=241478 RepID=A0A183IY19_9BILA|nr:unnamed protein product [Soboliphyme baturini]